MNSFSAAGSFALHFGLAPGQDPALLDLPPLHPFTAFISSVMGHEDIPDYDPVPPLLSDFTSFLRGELERH